MRIVKTHQLENSKGKVVARVEYRTHDGRRDILFMNIHGGIDGAYVTWPFGPQVLLRAETDAVFTRHTEMAGLVAKSVIEEITSNAPKSWRQ